MAKGGFLHMRLSPEDREMLEALVDRMNRDQALKEQRRPHVGKPRNYHSRSDAVRLAIAEALSRRREERI